MRNRLASYSCAACTLSGAHARSVATAAHTPHEPRNPEKTHSLQHSLRCTLSNALSANQRRSHNINEPIKRRYASIVQPEAILLATRRCFQRPVFAFAVQFSLQWQLRSVHIPPRYHASIRYSTRTHTAPTQDRVYKFIHFSNSFRNQIINPFLLFNVLFKYYIKSPEFKAYDFEAAQKRKHSAITTFRIFFSCRL